MSRFSAPDAEVFLRALFGDFADGYLEVRAISEHARPRQFFPALPLPARFGWERLERLNETHSLTVRMAVSSQPRSDAIYFTHLPALWVDVDGQADERALERLPLPPSLVVSSGSGLHAYWLLASPLSIGSTRERGAARDLLRALARAAGGDEAVCDVARVMRLAGSVNRKTKYAPSYPVARICAQRPERYHVDALRAAFALWLPLPTPEPTRAIPPRHARQPLPRWVEDYLTHGAGLGSRNQTLFRAACALRACGWDEASIHALLAPRGRADELTEHEVQAALRSAARYEAAVVPRHLRRVAALEDSHARPLSV